MKHTTKDLLLKWLGGILSAAGFILWICEPTAEDVWSFVGWMLGKFAVGLLLVAAGCFCLSLTDGWNEE